ncbi:MAG: lipid-A-disaccharide synthase [Acidobacteria bacterium RIFCSPLOWO2_02_FULL_61_28]|nr:MAG: lipid-A-disaccharide synthase [Acidobacteria bacterium RIFCSPLOWO2_02_FULL_61_28]
MGHAHRIFVSAGEASGDLYGALLIRALRERLGEVAFFGCGGDRMRDAGCRTLVDARQVAMVGIVEVLPGLPRAWRALQQLRNAIRKDPPALAILVDFPDFNLRLAKELKRVGTPVLYFVAPQVWAWRPGRLATLRRYVDRLLCIFPFEESFFRAAGVPAEFVGHPLLGRVAPTLSPGEFRTRFQLPETTPLVALLPGSRRREILLNLPPLLETARQMAAEGEYCFLVPAASTVAGDWIRARVAEGGSDFRVIENHTYDALAHAAVALVASGTATIETALLGTPMVVVYRVSRLTWWLGRNLVRTPFFSMVNLVAGRKIVPEFIQDQFQPEAVAREARQLVDCPPVRERMRQELRAVAEKLRGVAASPPQSAGGHRGTEEKTADAIQRAVGIAESLLLRPAGT